MAAIRSWLGSHKRTLGITLSVVIAMLLLGYRYRPDWFGFGPYNDHSGEFHPAKTVWDWLDLLIVPAVIAGGVYWLNRQERHAEREIAAERERENALQAYLDKMTELMLEKDLRASETGSESRHIARARTLTALRILDGKRKGVLVQFLHESRLITTGKAIIDMDKANLSQAHLRFANLKRAALCGVDLREAHLRWTDLRGADLRQVNFNKAELNRAELGGANLSGANLTEANLFGANLRGARLQQVDLTNADLQLADLREADLTETTQHSYGAKTRVNLTEARLQNADMSKSRLHYADLSRANLHGVTLRGAFLSGANLAEADLTYSVLRGIVDLTERQLSKAMALKGATMPDSSRYDGRFNLEGDIEAARKEGIDIDDPVAMARWYAGEDE